MSLEHRVTFVVGVAHSGTTVLYRLLARHPDLGWFSQFSRRDGTVPGRLPFPLEGVYNRIMRAMWGVPWRKKRGWDEYVIPRPMEANAIWEYLLPPREREISPDPVFYRSEDITSTMVKRFDRVIRNELDAWRRDRLICKLPRLSRAVDLLANLLPEARFVHVVRDGRAVALSNQHKFARRRDDPRDALRASARHWKRVVSDLVEGMGSSLPPKRWRSLKLESLQSDAPGTLNAAMSWLDLDERRFPLPFPDLRQDTNAKWRERTTNEQLVILREELSDLLEELGYRESWSPS